MRARLIFLDLAKPLAGFEPTVVMPIIADPADFARYGVTSASELDAGSTFAPELMNHAWADHDALPRFKTHDASGRHRPRHSIHLHRQRFAGRISLGRRLIKLHQ